MNLDANASKHKAMSYDRMDAKFRTLQAEVDSLLAAAEEQDRVAEEAAETAVPPAKTQRNFTGPDARMMKTNHGFDYAYNGQAIADETAQFIIATDLTSKATDVQQLVPMHETMTDQLTDSGIDRVPDVFLADAGYCSNANLAAAAGLASTVLVATGRERAGESFPGPDTPMPEDASVREAMADRLRQTDDRTHHARRKAIVEPVFGQMKTRQAAGQFRLRGLAAVECEWVLHAMCHNLRKPRAAVSFPPVKRAMATARDRSRVPACPDCGVSAGQRVLSGPVATTVAAHHRCQGPELAGAHDQFNISDPHT